MALCVGLYLSAFLLQRQCLFARPISRSLCCMNWGVREGVEVLLVGGLTGGDTTITATITTITTTTTTTTTKAASTAATTVTIILAITSTVATTTVTTIAATTTTTAIPTKCHYKSVERGVGRFVEKHWVHKDIV